MKAIYAGSFDPITYGHLWIIEQGLKICEELIITIAKNSDKAYTFSLNERKDMIHNSIQSAFSIPKNYRLVSIENELLVKYADRNNIKFLIRGIRNGNDYIYENSMCHINSDICHDITTLYLIPPQRLCEISSSLVKSLIGLNEWEKIIMNYVPLPVYHFLLKKYEAKKLNKHDF